MFSSLWTLLSLSQVVEPPSQCFISSRLTMSNIFNTDMTQEQMLVIHMQQAFKSFRSPFPLWIAMTFRFPVLCLFIFHFSFSPEGSLNCIFFLSDCLSEGHQPTSYLSEGLYSLMKRPAGSCWLVLVSHVNRQTVHMQNLARRRAWYFW